MSDAFLGPLDIQVYLLELCCNLELNSFFWQASWYSAVEGETKKESQNRTNTGAATVYVLQLA